MTKKYIFLSTIISLILLLCSSLHCSAQSATPESTEEDKLIEEETTRELKEVVIKPPPIEKIWSAKLGGWFNSIFRDYTDTDNNAADKDLVSWNWYQDLRLWSRINYRKDYSLYLRLKHSYTRRDTSARSTSYSSDYDGPHLDMAYINISKKDWSIPLDLTLGRQYLFVGRGIAYSNVHYGIKYKTDIKNILYLKTFTSISGENEYNIDQSVPNYNKTNDRIFAGLELAYSGIKNNIAYGFLLIQKDKNARFPPETPSQSYRYNSEYYGLGLQSNNPKSKLAYWLEVIKEEGSSYTDTASVDLEEKRIDAWLANCGLNYTLKMPLKPRIELEYAYASGDKDRSSVTDTRSGGNLYGNDTNFSYFGSFFSGYALAPRLSNMHIYKLDCTFAPFEKLKFGKEIVCGLKYFRYRKDKKAGGIYDTDATVSNLDIGQEADFYFYWKLRKNIFWSNRYGIFFPGDAYPTTTNNNTKYFYSRFRITF
ncbi:MAG: alginate export family protein [Candidatus Omnitrophica bacterium]|nr:alginate export family protein [Candidatus Omnitrophota bacterium]